jgi:hypothetical protein
LEKLVRDIGVSSQAEDARLVDEAREYPFLSSVQLKRNTAFPGCPRTERNSMTEAGLRSRSAAVKEKLSEEISSIDSHSLKIMWIVTG